MPGLVWSWWEHGGAVASQFGGMRASQATDKVGEDCCDALVGMGPVFTGFKRRAKSKGGKEVDEGGVTKMVSELRGLLLLLFLRLN